MGPGATTRGPSAPLLSHPQVSHLLAFVYMFATKKINGIFMIGR